MNQAITEAMSAWRLFPEGTVAGKSTAAFHAGLPRVPCLELNRHRPRLLKAAEFVWHAAIMYVQHANGDRKPRVSEIGCGDGGLLSLLKPGPHSTIDIVAWGYDVSPPNIAGAKERGVTAFEKDVFGVDRESIEFGDISVLTHVLQCITDPYDAVKWIGENSTYLVASVPYANGGNHHPDDTWAWDFAGFADLARQGGFIPVRHEPLGTAQLMLAIREE